MEQEKRLSALQNANPQVNKLSAWQFTVTTLITLNRSIKSALNI